MSTRTIWQYRGDISKKPAPALVEAAEGSLLIAKLLMNRGVDTPEAIRHFLDLESYEPTSGLELPDMEKALARIGRAIERQEPILIYGDFDVDGITGTSILYETLSFLGADVSYYIPDRATEGHGLNTAACIRLVSSRKTKLVITTDTGITNFAEVSLLKGLGVDTIVTDHHELPDNLPPSLANVNPKLLPDQSHPLAPLCGAGVAFKLCELLLDAHGTPEAEALKIRLLDLTAVGTVADMASLLLENRHLVYEGVKVLNTRQRLGMNAILEAAGTNPDAVLTSETVGFTIGPRLNALGRLDNATQAVELLTTHDPERARQIAAFLEQLNRKRRDLCDQTFLEAEQHIQRMGGLGDKRAIILASPDWNLGVIGIVASRLIEKYHVPVFMMVIQRTETQDGLKEVARCSARSIPGFHLHDQLLAFQDMFDGFGGHAGAGGFTLPLAKLDIFKERLYALTAQVITDEQMLPIIELDDALDWSQINPHLVGLIGKMAPFGMDNPAPKFALENAMISAQRNIGEGDRHLKLILGNANQKNAQPLEALYWNYNSRAKLNPSEPYRFVVSPELNTFNNSTKVQLILDDIKPQNENSATAAITEAFIPASVPVTNSAPPKSTPVAVAKPITNTAENNAPNWIDHRGREALESFVGQLMLPIQDKRSVLMYHEGKKPDIPFLEASLLVSRLTLKPAEELILWDFPPSKDLMLDILQTVQPKMLHWVGGKFQSVPVFQPEKNYLSLIMQTLKKRCQTNGSENTTRLDTPSFAASLAISTEVVNSGLVLLSKIGFIQNQVVGHEIQVTLNQQAPGNTALTEHLEYLLFQQAIGQMAEFRNWLLSDSLDKIRATLQPGTLSDTPQPALKH